MVVAICIATTTTTPSWAAADHTESNVHVEVPREPSSDDAGVAVTDSLIPLASVDLTHGQVLRFIQLQPTRLKRANSSHVLKGAGSEGGD